MTCPFLKEAQVKYCQTSSVRKLIPIATAGRTDEKCSSQEHLTCPVFRMQSALPSVSGLCPYLGESLMQYCSAAPVAKMIPYSESQISRCGCDRFRCAASARCHAITPNIHSWSRCTVTNTV